MTAGRVVLLVVAANVLAGCGGGNDDGADRIRVEADGFAVLDAWSRPTAPGIDTAALYVTIANRTAPDDVITSMSSPRCSSVVPHRTEIDDDGIARMPSTIGDDLALPAGGQVTMEPNGLHLMCLGLASRLEQGDTIDLAIGFRTHAPVSVSVAVEQR